MKSQILCGLGESEIDENLLCLTGNALPLLHKIFHITMIEQIQRHVNYKKNMPAYKVMVISE